MTTLTSSWTEIREWIMDKFIEPAACVVCKDNNWHMVNEVWEVRKHYPGKGMAIVTGDPKLIIAALICLNCKQVLFFEINEIVSSMNQ